MTTEQKQVKDFMLAFGQEVKDKPELPSEEVRKLRAILILEEAIECIEALGFRVRAEDQEYSRFELVPDEEPCLVKLADGLADLHYVAYCGTGLACGLDMERVFEEVHESNLTKLWTGNEVFKASTDEAWSEAHRQYMIALGCVDYDTRAILVTRLDGKVIKSPSYKPPNLNWLLK